MLTCGLVFSPTEPAVHATSDGLTNGSRWLLAAADLTVIAGVTFKPLFAVHSAMHVRTEVITMVRISSAPTKTKRLNMLRTWGKFIVEQQEGRIRDLHYPEHIYSERLHAKIPRYLLLGPVLGLRHPSKNLSDGSLDQRWQGGRAQTQAKR